MQINNEKTIPWDVLEDHLYRMRKDQAWFVKQMAVGANVVTNWKARGVPKRHAGVIAEILGISSDALLGINQKSPANKSNSLNLIYVDDEELRLLTLYRETEEKEKGSIFEIAEATPKVQKVDLVGFKTLRIDD